VSAVSGARLERFRAAWNKIEIGVIGTLVVAALIVFLYGSLTRTVAPSYAPDWSEEVTIYLIVWATLLSGGILAAERNHVSAQIAGQLLPARLQRYLRIGVEFLSLAFCAVMAGLGVQAVLFAEMLDERSASTLQAPQAWALYLALPVGMILIVVRIALLLVREFSGEARLPGEGADEHLAGDPRHRG
jgi:TRAP-type C4-dicarboxylate transport system permease small subunit